MKQWLSQESWQLGFIGLILMAALWTVYFASILPSSAVAKTSRCAIIIPTSGREILVNQCNKCLVINITRKRPGNAIPATRSYNVQPKSRFTLPFRGPGRSRVTSVLPCKGEPGAAENLMDPDFGKMRKKPEKKTCVSIERSLAGDLQLVNDCNTCKAALIELYFGSRSQRKRQAFKVLPNSPLKVPSQGASKITILAEVKCP
jgi:hypothetical protein